jgi:hypothetical protein
MHIKFCGLLALTLFTVETVKGSVPLNQNSTAGFAQRSGLEPTSFGLAVAGIGLFCLARLWRSLQLVLNLGFLLGVLVLLRAIFTIASIARNWSMPKLAAPCFSRMGGQAKGAASVLAGLLLLFAIPANAGPIVFSFTGLLTDDAINGCGGVVNCGVVTA